MTDDFLEMIYLKESLHKRFHRNHDPNIWTEFKDIRNRLTCFFELTINSTKDNHRMLSGLPWEWESPLEFECFFPLWESP